MQPPMRSSIACLRCRKSKTKCDNDNTGSPCDTCIKAGHKCEFPDPTPLPAKQSKPPTALRQVREVGHDRKRVKKLEDATSSNERTPAALAQEVLPAPYLTVGLWHQLFDIFKLHFATELPFLHLPTLKGIIHDKDSKNLSTESNLILLGILTLTARFHPVLIKCVAHITHIKIAGPRSRGALPSPQPSMASEYFANALTKALGELESALTSATVVRVQAILMLSLYKWSQPNGGLAAWMYVGVAIRMAQGLKLGSGDKPLGGKRILALSPRSSKSAKLSSDHWIDREIRRRTMFSCLIMDRLLSCGSDRVSMVRSDDLQIQLPCTEHAFDHGRVVYTGFLRQMGHGMEPPISDSVLRRFVQLADVWGDITKYSVEGGRLEEPLPPWNQESTFYQLCKRVDDFYKHLPEDFTWSSANFWGHNDSVYISLHMLGALCKIILHRECIPFIAIKCSKPTGPLGEFVSNTRTVLESFWERSAEQVFKAGREIIDLVSLCRDRLPHSPLVMFAIWQAAFVETYAWHYPRMDTQSHMASKHESEERQRVQTGIVSIALQALIKLAPFSSMASKYVTFLEKMDHFLQCGGLLEPRRVKINKTPSSDINLDDDQPTAYDDSDESRARNLERSSRSGPGHDLPSKKGTDTPRDFRQSSSYIGLDADVSLSYQQSDDSGLTRDICHHSLTDKYPQTPVSLPFEAVMAILNGERLTIDSYVRPDQSMGVSAVLNDVRDFATGEMGQTPGIGDQDTA
ncbi:fungal-specific transcription factor [Colletotrichum godetiae]|uniref:Fungal-specific transcription factor n=1 Tax=Colletotrichum godetiae TaxID=1209918 RepID=A0AAJ0EM05_9PEZI|nr:fungal-specific transcription factor [Colletotrichum godetiae]KAK1656926.1 fungal-specific transcription factor [Colletotrichum godetiae]